jgi:hypothetical protein
MVEAFGDATSSPRAKNALLRRRLAVGFKVPPRAPSFVSSGGTVDARGEVSELAEGARLEIACVPKRCVEGSNPSLSA